MKSFQKLLVRELQSELQTRDVNFATKDRKSRLQELLRAYFEEKYPDRDIDELDFNDKVRFFEFESEKRSRSGSRDLEEDKRDMTIVDEDLTMTPSKELKKAQPRLYDMIVKKGKSESEGKDQAEEKAKMGGTTSKVDDLNEFTKRRKEKFPDDGNDKEKTGEEETNVEKGEKIDITKSSDEDDVAEVSPVISRIKPIAVTIENEKEEQKEIGPEQGVNDEEEIIHKSPVAKRNLEINQNDETEPAAKRVKEMRIEENVEDSDDDEAPEEIKFTAPDVEPVITSERKKRRKNKPKVDKNRDNINIQAPLDPSVFEQMEEEETVMEIHEKNAAEKVKSEEKKKRTFELPDESGVHFVKQKKVNDLSKKSSSALAFREAMMGRHVRQSAESRRREKEKKKWMKK